jgi:hypothetical protein
MNWRLILSLSLFGLVLGIASVIGLTREREWIGWLLIGAYAAWKFGTRIREEFFLHGFYLGILTGVFGSCVQALFISAYLGSNPRMVEALNALPQGLHPSAVILIMGPIIGTVIGVVYGVMAVGVGRLMSAHPR